VAIIPSIINWLNNKRINQIELFKKFPEETQQEVLYSLLAKASKTEWGKEHDYTSISTIRDFQNRMKVQTYEDLMPYVERLRNGECDLLWPGEIKWFAKSSGTTCAKSKFIPVTRESLEECHYRGGKDMLIVYIQNNPDTNIFNGKSLILGGSHQINNFSFMVIYLPY
jgi:hypothetical protein